ncbi:MAG: pyruvate kinase [Polyangiaceae bacterium]
MARTTNTPSGSVPFGQQRRAYAPRWPSWPISSGPKIRVGLFEEGSAELRDGETVVITSERVLGTAKRFSSQYEDLPRDVEPGSRILLDDGNLELRVENVAGTEVTCTVVHGGRLKDKRESISRTSTSLHPPSRLRIEMTRVLRQSSRSTSLPCPSFADGPILDGLRQLLAEEASNALVVAKIEKPEALEEIDGILDVSDAIMVARGDLGVELDLARVPNVQEELVDRARARRKPVIVATQMLESMITAARPTRAEVTDVANAVRSGADAVMLSAETAAGHFPLGAAQTLDTIVRQTEAYLFEHGAFGGIFQLHANWHRFDVCRSTRLRCGDCDRSVRSGPQPQTPHVRDRQPRRERAASVTALEPTPLRRRPRSRTYAPRLRHRLPELGRAAGHPT